MPFLRANARVRNPPRKLLIPLNSLRWFLRRDARTGANILVLIHYTPAPTMSDICTL